MQAKRTLDSLGTTPRSRHGCRGFQGRRPSPCTLDDRGRLAPLAGRGAGGSGWGPLSAPSGGLDWCLWLFSAQAVELPRSGGCRAGARSAGGGPKARRSRRGACPPRGGAALRGSSTGRGRRRTLKTLKVKKPRARVTGSENRRKANGHNDLQNRVVCETTIGRCVKPRVYPQKKVCETTCPSTDRRGLGV